jgi:hypothetical protein
MKISLTLGDIITKYDWEKFCKLKGYNLDKSLIESSEYITLTEEEARQIGIKFIGEEK